MNIGEKIKIARKKLKMSQQQLGGEELTKGYISQIEKGTVNPSVKVLKLISERLQMPLSYFLDEGSNDAFQEKFTQGKNLYLQEEYLPASKVFREITACDTENSTALLYLGKCLFFMESYEESMSTLKKSEKLLKEALLYKELVEGYKFMGDCCFNCAKYDEALKYYETGLKVMSDNKLKLHGLKARFLLNAGSAYLNVGSFKTAVKYFESNIEYCRELNICDTLLDCCTRIGYCFYQLENYSASKEYLLKAAAMNRIFKYPRVYAEIYNNLALTLSAEGKVSGALKVIDKSISIYFDGINAVSKLIILNASSKFEEAVNFGEEYMKKVESVKNKAALYLFMGELGISSINNGDFQVGEELLKKSIQGCTEEQLNFEVSKFSKALGEYYLDAAPEKCKKYYNLSIEYAGKCK